MTSLAREVRDLNKSISLSSAGGDLIRAAKLMAAARGNLEIARKAVEQPGYSERVRAAINNASVGTKAAVTIGGLNDNIAWYRELAEGFVASMSAFSAFSKILTSNDFYPVPLRTIMGILTSAPVGDTSAEGFAKAISSGAFSTAKLEPLKSTSTIVVTNELARSISDAATAQFAAEIRRAASIELDRNFLSILASTSGVTSAASTGVTSTAILADLTGRLTALTIGADSRLYWVVSPKLYKQLSLVQGTGGFLVQANKIGQITVVPSDAATTTAYLIDAKQVAAVLDSVNINTSGSATIQLADNPTSTAYQLFSAWQNNATVMMCEIWYGCLLMRSTGCTLLTGYS
jgi:hypothetical protein